MSRTQKGAEPSRFLAALSRWEGVASLVVVFGLGVGLWSRLTQGPWQPTTRWWLGTVCLSGAWVMYLFRGVNWFRARYRRGETAETTSRG